jgi:hypothetical protein
VATCANSERAMLMGDACAKLPLRHVLRLRPKAQTVLCPQAAKADIGAQTVTSGVEPEPT